MAVASDAQASEDFLAEANTWIEKLDMRLIGARVQQHLDFRFF